MLLSLIPVIRILTMRLLIHSRMFMAMCAPGGAVPASGV